MVLAIHLAYWQQTILKSIGVLVCVLLPAEPRGAAQTDVLKAHRPKNGQSAHNHALCALVPQSKP